MKNIRHSEFFDLPCYDNRKSFYGKAKIEEIGAVFVLYSYDTPVCAYDSAKEVFTRLWEGYSATTMRHINSFLYHYGLHGGGKKWWDKLEVDKEVSI